MDSTSVLSIIEHLPLFFLFRPFFFYFSSPFDVFFLLNWTNIVKFQSEWRYMDKQSFILLNSNSRSLSQSKKNPEISWFFTHLQKCIRSIFYRMGLTSTNYQSYVLRRFLNIHSFYRNLLLFCFRSHDCDWRGEASLVWAKSVCGYEGIHIDHKLNAAFFCQLSDSDDNKRKFCPVEIGRASCRERV